MADSNNIHPVFDRLVQRHEREQLNGHRGCVVWLTGLSGSGKSTVAAAVERELFSRKWAVRVLDGDNVRSGLNAGLSFSLEDRQENIRRVAEVAKLFCQTGFVTLCSFVSPTQAIRSSAEKIVGSSDFFEVHVSADLAACERRDVKGLYAKARAGEIKGFTGIDSPYEAPSSPALTLQTGSEAVTASATKLLEFITATAAIAPPT